MPTSTLISRTDRRRWHDVEHPEPHVPVLALQPVYLKMDLFHWGIVGDGSASLTWVHALLKQWPDARVTLYGKRKLNEWEHLSAQYPGFQFVHADSTLVQLARWDVVVVVSDDMRLNRQVAQAARTQGKLVFVPGIMALSNFTPNSSFMRGDQLSTALPEQESWVKQLTGLDFRQGHWLDNRWQQLVSLLVLAFFFMLIGHFLFAYWSPQALWATIQDGYSSLTPMLFWTAVGGFLAQLVDGALGMGYGVTSASILLSTGVPPAAISSSIHTAEIFASGVSGYSHYRFGNVNKRLFKVLVIPGVIGAAIGALLLVYVGETYSAWIKPILAVYTMLLGMRILWNAIRHTRVVKKFKQFTWLAAAGGFLDSFGGGGWGPLVTSTLISKGRTPRFVIGTVSLTEFFVTLVSALTFFSLLGLQHWSVIVALITGSVLAAPLAARLTGKLPRKASMVGLGILVIIWSLRILIKMV